MCCTPPRAASRRRRVLVHNAAGGVGSAAVQLALIAGRSVIGVAGSEAKTRAVIELGAGQAINYRTEDVAASGASRSPKAAASI